MAIIDEFKSEKNRNLIIQASTKMLLDKYNLSLNPDIMINIINTIIISMSKDAILMNNTVKLMELNTITLTKMKDYVNKNLDDINVSVSTPTPIANEQNIYNDGPTFNKDEEINKNDILTNEELLIKVKDYENKRNIANTILVNIDNMEVAGEKNIIMSNNEGANNTVDSNKLISEIIEKVFETMNKNINKKTLIINSYCRDWINNPQRNKLNFAINIDLQNNIIEPFKILFPKYVKDITPYIKLVITDNHHTYKFNFIYSKSSGKWDIWELMNKDNIHINLANKNWRISFYDYINNELKLGNDDIKISQINDFQMNNYDNTENNMNIDTNIDNILTTQHNDMNDIINDNCKKSKDKNKMTFYELNIDYSNIMEYDEYNLNIICKYDYIQLKTRDNKYVNVKVIDINNNQGKIIISNENNLRKEDFANSSILNYGAQYSIILTYYHKIRQ